MFAYTLHILNNMKHLPYDNSIKSNIAYTILYTVELHGRLSTGEAYENIFLITNKFGKRNTSPKAWKY